MSHIKSMLQCYLQGIANLFDFTGVLFPHSSPITTSCNISNALASDWKAIGQDMQRALDRYSSYYIEVFE